jgi:hypothetical protein
MKLGSLKNHQKKRCAHLFKIKKESKQTVLTLDAITSYFYFNYSKSASETPSFTLISFTTKSKFIGPDLIPIECGNLTPFTSL